MICGALVVQGGQPWGMDMIAWKGSAISKPVAIHLIIQAVLNILSQ